MQPQEPHTHASCPREGYLLPREMQRLLVAAIRVWSVIHWRTTPSEPRRGPAGDQGAEKDKGTQDGHLGSSQQRLGPLGPHRGRTTKGKGDEASGSSLSSRGRLRAVGTYGHIHGIASHFLCHSQMLYHLRPSAAVSRKGGSQRWIMRPRGGLRGRPGDSGTTWRDKHSPPATSTLEANTKQESSGEQAIYLV